jgi:GDP-L-fucose synthase
MSEIIIFGSTGFVGKNLDIKSLRPTKEECDLLNYNSLIKFLFPYKNKHITIINLAAKVAGIEYNKSHNVEMFCENSIMCLNLIKVIKELNMNCYYIYVSSVCVFSHNSSYKEDNCFLNHPFSSNFGYGWSKRIGMLGIECLKKDDFKFESLILIPSNMYGPYDNFGEYCHVVPSLIKKFAEPSEVRVLGNSKNIRSFLYVKDFCNILKNLIKNKRSGTYNISCSNYLTIRQLSQKISKLSNFSGDIKYSNFGRIEKRKIDNKKLIDILDYQFTPLDEGLKNTIEYYKNYVRK